ncbi:MAG: NapC/NirT family cytochrome c [Candidatus Hydrogenedentes bacterium]|nr:NapC/NirT family cytochrome c [Candidatus Hydrogenedentota bacterium]
MTIRKDSKLAILILLFGRNWITLFGTGLTTSTAMMIVGFLTATMLGFETPPYLGILMLLIMPGFFVLGLLIIPIGIFWGKRKKAVAEGADAAHITINLRRPEVRGALGLITLLTGANLLIMALVSYRSVEYMDSTEFCGKTCHTVMKPEFTAHAVSPHSRVSCVECHIGPGAPWFVKAKISGVRQVFAVALHTYEHPIPTPVANLRPSRDTCEQCHWPQKFTGDRVKVVTEYTDDEKNTALKTALLMHIGGGELGTGGIHSWHIDPRRKTTYVTTDRQRQKIDLVRVTEADGTVTEYKADGKDLTPEQLATAETRIMDCIDCHNRPTHIYQMPGRALDDALHGGRIDASLPFVKKIAAEALTEAKGAEGDLELIDTKIRSFYQEKYKDVAAAKADKIDEAVREVQGIYSKNVFPDMSVTWGTYPNNIGHTVGENQSPGCFRCHDDSHVSADGKTIKQDCTMCHTVLAMQEENPAALQDLGLH